MLPRILLHTSMQARIKEFYAENPRHFSSVETAFRKLQSDPISCGLTLTGITQADICGKIYRLHVGGRDKYRLIYYADRIAPNTPILAVPLFMSISVRGNFDYSKLNLNTIGKDILADLRAKNYQSFVDGVTWLEYFITVGQSSINSE